MSDERLRRLEREAASGDRDALVKAALANRGRVWTEADIRSGLVVVDMGTPPGRPVGSGSAFWRPEASARAFWRPEASAPGDVWQVFHVVPCPLLIPLGAHDLQRRQWIQPYALARAINAGRFRATEALVQRENPPPKKCAKGLHDFDPTTRVCRRRGCGRSMDAPGQGRLFGSAREDDPTVGAQGLFWDPGHALPPPDVEEPGQAKLWNPPGPDERLRALEHLGR